MKLNLEHVLVDPDRKPVGEAIPGTDPVETKDLTLGSMLRQSLLGLCEGDDKPNGENKMLRYQLSLTLEKPEPDLSIEELTVLKGAIENRNPQLLPWLFGQVMLLLDGKETGL